MRFLVDNALSPMVAAGLATAGHDAIHVRDRGMAAAPDVAIVTLAASEDRIVVSSDADFGAILAVSGRNRPSVIQFRGNMPNEPDKQVALILRHLSEIQDELSAGALVTFQPSRIRIRPLPMA